MIVRSPVVYQLSISFLLCGCATGPNPSETDLGYSRSPLAPVPVCGPAHRWEPQWIPSNMNVVNNWARPHWKYEVIPSRAPDGTAHSERITTGPYPMPFAFCADQKNSPVYVMTESSQDGPVDWEGSEARHYVLGSCMVGRANRASAGVVPYNTPQDHAFHSWNYCGDEERHNIRYGHRVQWVIPDFPTSIAPLDRKLPIRSPLFRDDYWPVLASEPSPMVAEICGVRDAYVSYSSAYPSPDNSSMPRYKSTGECRVIEARSISLYASDWSGTNQPGTIRILSIKP